MEYEALEDMEKGGGALRTIKDLAAGAAGGMAQVLLGRSTCGLRRADASMEMFPRVFNLTIYGYLC